MFTNILFFLNLNLEIKKKRSHDYFMLKMRAYCDRIICDVKIPCNVFNKFYDVNL